MKANSRPKKPLNLSIDREVFAEFEKIAAADHLEPQRLAALLISKFSDLKQGNALTALAAIPKDLYKLRPGRIASTPSASDSRPVGMTAQHAI
jgi:hypothetical protein